MVVIIKLIIDTVFINGAYYRRDGLEKSFGITANYNFVIFALWVDVPYKAIWAANNYFKGSN